MLIAYVDLEHPCTQVELSEPLALWKEIIISDHLPDDRMAQLELLRESADELGSGCSCTIARGRG